MYLIQLGYSLLVLLLSFSNIAAAGGMTCPPYSIGLHKVNENGETSYFAVSRTEAFDNTEESFDMAEAEARLTARKLIGDKVFKRQSVILKGAQDIAICRKKKFVYAVVKQSPRSQTQADNLKNQIDDSMRKRR